MFNLMNIAACTPISCQGEQGRIDVWVETQSQFSLVQVPEVRIVEVPVDRVIERRVEVPVDRVVERVVKVPEVTTVEVPVETIKEKIVTVWPPLINS